MNEKEYVMNGNKKELIIKVDKKYYRPLEIDYLKGNQKKDINKHNNKIKNNHKD